MQINGREISSRQPPYCVAEISGNHCGSLDEALRLIEAAKNAGASAVKFQCYTPGELTLDSDKSDFIIKEGLWKGRRLYDLYEAAYTPREWFGWLFEQGRRFGITVFSSVFSQEGVDFLESFDCPAYKIASMEITDTELIKYAAATGKPIIFSTGMASYNEIGDVYRALAEARKTPEAEEIQDILRLHCISGYPTPIEEARLRNIRSATWNGSDIGISDHTEGWTIPVAATVLGACLIEKHFYLLDPTKSWEDQKKSEDIEFSIDQFEFADMVVRCKQVWKAMQPCEPKSEEASRQLRRSLYVVRDMKKGQKFTAFDVRSIRPSYGLPPSEILKIIGKTATQDIESGTALKWEMVDAGAGKPQARDLLSERVQGADG